LGLYAGHGTDPEGPMFRPYSHNRRQQETRRPMDPDAIDRVLRKHGNAIGLDRGFSAHSMRATFITTALENDASLEDVQRAAGHREPGIVICESASSRSLNPSVTGFLFFLSRSTNS
jgi:integrase/recombinase XerD